MSEKINCDIKISAFIINCNECKMRFAVYGFVDDHLVNQVDDTCPIYCPYCGKLTGGK